MISKKELKNDRIMPFKFKKLKNGRFFLSNSFGEHIILKKDKFNRFITKDVSDLSKEFKEKLLDKNFIKPDNINDDELSVLLASKRSQRHKHFFKGPSLHIMVLTLSCNHVCKYCHASAKPSGTKDKFSMDKETAKKTVDVIFESTSGNINIEFQGGEPLMNWDVLRYVVNYAKKKNQTKKHDLAFTVVTNLTLMDEDKLDFLVENDIQIATSLDGHKKLHDSNRNMIGKSSSYDNVTHWINKIQKKLKAKEDAGEKGKINFPGGLVTVTKETLKYPEKLVNSYIENDLKTFFMRPLNPYGFAEKVWDKIGYTSDEYLKFYKKVLNYIDSLKDKKGIELADSYSGILSQNLCGSGRTTYTEELAPFCGAVLQQVAYNWDGKIYTCDEGRMLAASGDNSFQIGKIDLDKTSKDIYNDFLKSRVTEIVLYSSMIDYIPGYDRNPNTDYVGICPIYSYTKSNNIISKYKKEMRYKLQDFTLNRLITNSKENEKQKQ